VESCKVSDLSKQSTTVLSHCCGVIPTGHHLLQTLTENLSVF